MRHRINLFLMYATCVCLLALSAVDRTRFEAVYAQLPGGRENVPRFTQWVMGMLGWLATWWPLCLLLGAAAAFGGPALLRRTPAGERLLTKGERWLTEYHATVVVAFVAFMFTAYWTVDQAMLLPWLRIIEALTGAR